MEVRCLRSVCGVTRIGRICREEIRIILGVQNKMSVRVDKCVPRWFGHVERMDDERMDDERIPERLYDSGVQGKPTRIWMDDVKEAVTYRGCPWSR